MNNKDLMNHAADNIRLLAVSMVEKAKSGHPGGAMGGADFINVLFSEFLVFDPDQPTWEGRDRFYLDPGHMSPMLYSALALQGKYTIDDLKTFRQWGTICPGHPERDIIHGIENTSGPLGQGHTYAVGAAIAEKFLEARLGSTMMQHKIYAYISDGGVQEEISQGAGRIAGLFKLNNLIMFYDANEIQLSTECDVVMRENTRMKYESWGWNVLEINGNAPDEIRAALILANKEENRPTLIIGHTVMAKGARKEDGSSYERSVKTHGAPLGGGAYENTVKNLGGDLNDPFVVFDDVKELYEKRNAELREIVKERHAAEEEWRKANPEKAEQMKAWFSGDAPKVDWSALVQKRDVATRVASANCLGVLAEQVPNMVCSSADLCNSDKTDGFLKKTHELAPDDFTGAFFQAGVSELTMACVCIGMYLHGGVIPACGTFFVFSDYMKPAIRMAALMRVPIKFVWSHDAFRVGEDGPTHEPVEQEAQIRLMEKLKNHKGQDSVRVFRPADADETTVCWQMANENMDTPTAMICSRQNVNSLPEGTDYSQVRKGAYIVKDDPNYDVILLASGSEVSTLLAGAELLNADGIKTRIVSVPSEGLFRTQSKEYQESVLPKGAKIFGMTAGLPVTLQSLVGVEGMVYGLESFGFSAPYKVLDEKLGFNAENVYKQVKDYLSK
ncbi:MAG: transketolase [Prevotella stercorea]|uniref:transketolase family protein n=1 Tax=Leyella stercorea TaxID=363265 RepID=UPI001F3CC32D|nr:transketolase [Leyella stercorea]MCI6687224.1 transketolase [Prevotella sp.]MCF2614636.1 transketolase [Leyella stercorea]MDD6496638.1 transketolase [Leyella stercorea]MDD7719883.1 transketolase [Leyella stercorea]MDY4197858.1 transketolase [Prevotella sp.]